MKRPSMLLCAISKSSEKQPEIRACYPDVEWNKLAGLRDIVAHKYFGLDEDIRISPDTEASLP